MEYATRIRTFDMDAAERRAIEEADARQTAKEMRDILKAIQVTLSNIDDMIVGSKLK